MSKLKLFVYQGYNNHVHDEYYEYVNTVPMSKTGISEHFIISPPESADYFYMGQISDGTYIPSREFFKYLEGNENKHICDIEGDWFNKKIPDYLKKCILTINGARKEYNGVKMFVRPTFSFLFMDIIKNKDKHISKFNEEISFGFRGQFDPRGVRKKMYNSFLNSGLKYDITFNNKWMAMNHIDDYETKKYIELLKSHTFSLCPSGTGYDSIRFYESCYYGSIPVIISDIFVPFENEFVKPFFFQISMNESQDYMTNKLQEIANTDVNVLRNMSLNAQEYFETYIREYFKDPTKMFLNWLNKL